MWIFKTDTGTFKGEREKVWFRNENTDKVKMDWQGEINLAEDATPPPPPPPKYIITAGGAFG